MKNWEPFVFGPAFYFHSQMKSVGVKGEGGMDLERENKSREEGDPHTAIESNPGWSCLSLKFSSANLEVP